LKKKQTKNKTPLPLRIIPILFPWLEKLFPWAANRFFVYIFFSPFRYKTPDKEVTVMKSSQPFSVMLDRKKIQCYGWGRGPTVFLLHGWAGRGLQLMKFIEPLTTLGYRVVAIDGPAHGRSQGNRTDLEEFRRTLQLIWAVEKDVCAIIAHSFGGVASLYAIAEGLPVKILVNIASPTIGDEIINTYLRAINGSAKTGETFKQYVVKKSGKTFDQFTSLTFIKKVPEDFKLLLVYDQDDKEVIIKHAEALMEVYPKAELLKTTQLGHTRVLKDERVIQRVVTFVNTHSSKS
jgi:predicted alpha/beta hydrolase family esterase